MVCVDALAVKTSDVEAKQKNSENVRKIVLDDTLKERENMMCHLLVSLSFAVDSELCSEVTDSMYSGPCLVVKSN